jgi:hypothetical protein
MTQDGLVTCPQSSDPLGPVLISVSQEVEGVFLFTFLVADLERKFSGMRHTVWDQTVVTTTSTTTTELCRLHHLNRTDIDTAAFFTALLKKNVKHKSPTDPNTSLYT